MKYKVVRKQNNSSRCIVCGEHNDFSLGARFYDLENGEVAALFRTEDHHQSYPGRVHGGMEAAILDEVIGRAVCVAEPETWAVTVELTIKYKRPLPTEADLKAVGRVTRNTRKIFEGEGEILLEDGSVAATASGKYMKMTVEEIAVGGLPEKDWFYLEEDDPTEIDI